MMPQDQSGGMPPGLADLMGGGGAPDMGGGMGQDPNADPNAPPDQIDVQQPDQSDDDLIRTALDALEQAMNNESDDANSAAIAKIVHDLYKLTSGQQDAQITAMGGKPKETRALQRTYGPQ